MIKLELTHPTQKTMVVPGMPSMPVSRQPIVERKFADPSSCPKGERYPVPHFFEYRIKPREHDPL